MSVNNRSKPCFGSRDGSFASAIKNRDKPITPPHIKYARSKLNSHKGLLMTPERGQSGLNKNRRSLHDRTDFNLSKNPTGNGVIDLSPKTNLQISPEIGSKPDISGTKNNPEQGKDFAIPTVSFDTELENFSLD